IKIGVIQPLSGPVAASGNYIRMGAEIGRDWVNARGGVLGRKVELLIEDNKSDPKEAATAAEKLIVLDKVPVIVGAWGSSMTLAAMPKLEEYGVPMIGATSSAATITKRGNPWVFRISPPSEMEAVGLEKYLKEFGIKKADFLAVNTDWGRGSVSAFGDLLKKSGAAVGVAEFMEQSATDMNEQITKIKADTAATVCIETAVEGMRIAGKPDPKAVREALWKVNAMGVNGPIKFEKDGPAGKESGQSQPSIFIVQIRDGKITLPSFVKRS